MKKLVAIVTTLSFSVAAFAQKSEVKAAKNALSDKDFVKAQKSIDAAVIHPETQSDPGAWLTRSTIYLIMQQQPGNDTKDFYTEAGKSLMKVVELKPTYEKDDVNKKFLAVAQMHFNDGIKTYEKQDFSNAYNHFGDVVKIYELEAGKRFAGNKTFDTIAHQAATYEGYSAYYDNKYDEALPLLQKAKADPLVKDVRNYLMIADIYEAKNDDANLLAVINEAKTEYPKDQSVVNRELNYYVKKGKIDVLITKLEDAVKADPGNGDLLFNLAIAYDNLANPKDKAGKDMPKPSNYNDLFAKAETSYEKTSIAAPSKAEVFYNYAALYFNRAVLVNEQMNVLGSSPADIKKYDGLKIERDQWFKKALPHFEKVISIWEPQVKNLGISDFNTYVASVSAAKEIYAKQNNIEKANELKKKLEAAAQK